MEILLDFSETLSELMLIEDLKAEGLAERVEIDRSNITRYLERKTIPTLAYAIRLADYFGCSLDYLFCLNNEYCKKEYVISRKFFQVFQELLKSNDCSRYRIGKDLKYPNNTLNDWFYGVRLPKIDNLIKIADYFNCTLDELVGRKAVE